MSRGAILRVAGAVAIIGGVAAAAVVLAGSRDGPERPEVPTTTVTETEFRREIPAEGTLKAVDTTPITAPQNARMPLKVAWLVKDGERVEAGAPVVRFDPTDMEEMLRNGRESVEQAAMRMHKERALSRTTQHRRDREAAMASSEMEAAKEFESVDDEIFSRHEIIKSQIDVELAAARMDHARRVKDIERSASAGKLDVLDVARRQAEMVVKRAEGGLAQIELVAPAGGVVLLRRDWRGKVVGVGDTVFPGMPLAEVAADASMEAEVFVLEADGGHLSEGLEAQVVIESSPDRVFSGKVKRVAKLAQPRNPKVPVQYFAVVISLDKTDPDLMKIGHRVRATIVEGESRALVVPRQAVFSDDGDSYVYRETDSGFEKVSVTLGPSTPGRVVIAEGLEPGDEIALRDPEVDDSAGRDQQAPTKSGDKKPSEGGDEAR